MKRVKLSTRKRYNKVRSKAYLSGRSEKERESNRLIERLQQEKENQFEMYLKSTKVLQANFNKQIIAIKEESKQEVEVILKEQEGLRKLEKKNYEKQIEKIKTMAMQRIKEMRDKAKAEIERANHAENQYRLIIEKTQTLFDKGTAKILRMLKNNDSLVNDAAKMSHDGSSFFKDKDELSQLLTDSHTDVSKLKIKQLENNSAT